MAPEDTAPDIEWLTPQAAAKLIGVRAEFVYATCRTRGLRHTRLGGKRHIRIHRDWLREWMNQHSQSHA
jgi:excisionase family DNA binding protein